MGTTGAGHVEHVSEVDRVARIITEDGQKPFTLFVGSGISYRAPTYAPSVERVREGLFDELKTALQQNPKLLRDVEKTLQEEHIAGRLRGMAFEALWERVAKVVKIETVYQALDLLYGKRDPNENHRAIGWLMSHGYIAAVFTTNYDECIEGAFPDISVSYGSVDPEEQMVQLCSASPKGKANKFLPPIYKLHGTLSRRESMAFMFPQITTGFREETLARLRAELQRHRILFVGYGANDWDVRELLLGLDGAVWTGREMVWSEVGERVQRLASGQCGWGYYQHDLLAPEKSAVVQLAKHWGYAVKSEGEHGDGADAVRSWSMLGSIDPSTRLEILGELLESLALEVAAYVFAEAARLARPGSRTIKLRIASFKSLGHGGMRREKIRQGVQLRHNVVSSCWERLAIESELAFEYLIDGQKLRSLAVMRRVRNLCNSLAPEAAAILFRDRAQWSSDDWFKAAEYGRAYHILAHNLVRFAWFYVGLPHLNLLANGIRAFGVREWLAKWARRFLDKAEPFVRAVGTLHDLAGHERESGHTLYLLRHASEAVDCLRLADEAWGWGNWYQWQSNAIRSTGWAYLGQHKDRAARQEFENARELALSYGRPQGEMLFDKIKAMLELKRLAVLHGWPTRSADPLAEFDRDNELFHDIMQYAILEENERSAGDAEGSAAGASKRFMGLARCPPKTRDPLG